MGKHRSIIIFGASDDSRKLISELYPLTLCGLINIVAICDNDSRIHGSQINDISIISPKDMASIVIA